MLHTAGPFDEDPDARVLCDVISARIPVYVYVADPLGCLAAARSMGPAAAAAGACAVVSAGAFPGFSNVLAVECAARLQRQQQQQQTGDQRQQDQQQQPGQQEGVQQQQQGRRAPSEPSTVAIRDVCFSYFTAGLGGSGPVNLLITNLGFGQPVPGGSNCQGTKRR